MWSAHGVWFTFGCLLVGAASAACTPSSASPTGPSPAESGRQSGATIAGTLDAGASGSLASAAGVRSLTGPLALLQVTVVGTNLSATLGDSGGFLLVNVPPGHVQLHFSGQGVSASATIPNVGVQDYIEIQVALEGGSTARIVGESRSAATLGICHLTGTGQFMLVHINPSAEAAHRAHGDGLPGETVPGVEPAATFGTNCEAPLVERPDRGEEEEEGDESSIKVELCHRTGTGRFVMISVDIDAEPAHMAHGDGVPNGPVPGSTGLTFGPACEMPSAIGAPASST